jgi:Kdo-III transferase WaaZ
MSVVHSYAWPKPTQRLSSTFFKLAYRWSHSGAYRHNERLWHGVSIERNSRGFLERMSIAGHDLSIENPDDLLASQKGECHLIATGPSVNDIDYGALDLHNVMGVNGAIALQDKYPVRFEYYCIVDAGFVRKRPDLIARVVQQKLTLFTTPLVLWYIAQYFPLSQFRCRVFLIEDIRYPACKRALLKHELLSRHAGKDVVMFDEEPALGFSFNIRRGIFDGRTVAYSGLQVLTSLGFNTIFMHGLDLLNAARTPRFYETKENMQPSALDGDFNSFIEPSFRHAVPLLNSRGIRIVNLSSESALGSDIIEKDDWHALAHATIEQE